MGRESQQAEDKEDQGEWPGGVVEEELANHPDAVSADPEEHGYVVDEFLAGFPGVPGNIDGHEKCGHDHGDSEPFEVVTPAGIFEDPEQDVEVLSRTNVFHECPLRQEGL